MLLCLKDVETIDHPLASCAFTKSVLRSIKRELNCPSMWISRILEAGLKNWKNSDSKPAFKVLPSYLCWGIWLFKNKVFFQGWRPCVNSIVQIMSRDFSEVNWVKGK